VHEVDALCSSCGKPCKYNGYLPILCHSCKQGGVNLGFTINATIGNPQCAYSTCDDCDYAMIVNDKVQCSNRS